MLATLKAKIIAGAAVVAALGLVWSHVTAYQAGAASERAATLNRSIEVLREKGKTDNAIRKLDDAGLCAAIGGVFTNGECM